MTLNLISDAWIPVRLRDGTRDVMRPAQMAEALDSNPAVFPDWPRPDLNIATLEFLIGLMSIAYAPEDTDEWLDVWEQPPSVADLDTAFQPLLSAFSLEGAAGEGEAGRFMQDFGALDEKGGLTSVESLLIDSSGTNAIKKNADVMVKRDRVTCYSPAAAAIVLYALQQFAPSGGAGHRTSMRGGGPLTTLVLPPDKEHDTPSLWQIVWANTPDREGKGFQEADRAKYFPWMAVTKTSDGKPVVEIHKKDGFVDPLQCFFGMPRRIKLVFEDNVEQLPCDLTGEVTQRIVKGYITNPWGMNYGVWTHPLSPYYLPKKGDIQRLPMHPRAGRFGYEQWVSVLLGDQEGETRFKADCVNSFLGRVTDLPKERAARNPRMIASGWAMSNMQPLDFVFSEQPFHLAATHELQKDLDALARRMVVVSGSAANFLMGGAQTALRSGGNAPGRDSTILTALRENFFASTEGAFHEILKKASVSDLSEEVRDRLGLDWVKLLQSTALSLFDEYIPLDPNRPEKAKPVVAGKKKLKKMLYGNGLYKEMQIGRPQKATTKKEKADG